MRKFYWIVFLCLVFYGKIYCQTKTKYITVDQFGYLPTSRKIAVIRDPQTGFDASESFIPGNTYAVVDATNNVQIFSAAPAVWNSGVEDISSGDKAWWFDFSSVTTPGKYFILDVSKNVRSYDFEISEAVYDNILRQAVRMYFYQRAGFEKAERYAGAGWADGASHLGNLQDKNARLYNKPSDASTELDVHGGWFDAGDYNKYSSWAADYVVDFMKAYLEKPEVWRDDYNIPESGNGIPDLLDEAKWELDFLLRMQRPDGSVLSIVGLSSASPPSSAKGQSLYGSANTSATLNAAGAFAIASKVYGSVGMDQYAATLKQSAIKAWDWAGANPAVIFKNNDSASGTSGLGAGQQETDDYGRLAAKLEAAGFLFEITGDTKYRDFFDSNYASLRLVQSNFAYPFETSNQEILLHYTTLPDATPGIVSAIKQTYKDAMNGSENFTAFYSNKDPYAAHLKDYTWGSNSIKASQGLMYMDMITYGIDATKETDAKTAAEGYIHYLHGTNPLNMVYLSNMYSFGGDNCVNEFYHTWFANGNAKWDRVGTSAFGPPPGYLTGGPNPSYNWDACCPNNCGGSGNNALCNSESLTPPKGQPSQKSYKDFNTSWPLDSWSVTENSCGYQINYIRLLSKFASGKFDCNGTKDGTATTDACGHCAGGDTGVTAVSDPSQCTAVVGIFQDEERDIEVYPNPVNKTVYIKNNLAGVYQVSLKDAMGRELITETHEGNSSLDLPLSPGTYFIVIKGHGKQVVKKIIKY